jgi:hypothetical protein
VNATSVYWATISGNGSGGSVMNVVTVPIDGGSPNTLASVQSAAASEPVNSLAVNGTSAYWTTGIGDGGTAVVKVPTVGGPTTTLASGGASPGGSSIAVDGTSVYWLNGGTAANNFSDGTVMKVQLGGGAVTTLATVQATVQDIAVDSTSVYWTGLHGVMKLTPK